MTTLTVGMIELFACKVIGDLWQDIGAGIGLQYHLFE